MDALCDGQWQWCDELGYTWIANEPWGWLPFHYGRWMEQSGLGWVWAPGKSAVFKPGEVYWLREAEVAGWGPLAPGENWTADAVPRLYLRANTTLARWKQDARDLVPAAPDEKLKTSDAVFVIALPSPALDSARLDAVRPALRAGSTRIVPILPGVTYTGVDTGLEPPELASMPVADTPVSAQPADALLTQPFAAPPSQPVPEPVEVYYPALVYTGIIVINPPERPRTGTGPVHERPLPPPRPVEPVKPKDPAGSKPQ